MPLLGGERYRAVEGSGLAIEHFHPDTDNGDRPRFWVAKRTENVVCPPIPSDNWLVPAALMSLARTAGHAVCG
jgi:hypothetical protein